MTHRAGPSTLHTMLAACVMLACVLTPVRAERAMAGDTSARLVYEKRDVPLGEVVKEIARHFDAETAVSIEGKEEMPVRVRLDAGSALEAMAQLSQQVGLGLSFYAPVLQFTENVAPVAGYTMVGPVLVAVLRPAPRALYYPKTKEPTQLVSMIAIYCQRPQTRAYTYARPVWTTPDGRALDITSDGGGSGSIVYSRYEIDPSQLAQTVDVSGKLNVMTYHNPFEVTVPYRKGATVAEAGLTIDVLDIQPTKPEPEASIRVRYDAGATPAELEYLRIYHSSMKRAARWPRGLSKEESQQMRDAELAEYENLQMLLRQVVIRNFELFSWWGYKLNNSGSWSPRWFGDEIEATVNFRLANRHGDPWPTRPSLSGASMRITFADQKTAIIPFRIDNITLNPFGPGFEENQDAWRFIP